MKVFVIKHDEYFTKGYLFSLLERKLVKDIRRVFEIEGIKARIKHERGRVYVFFDDEGIVKILKRIFGIYKIGIGEFYENEEEFREGLLKNLEKELVYKIEVKRSDKSLEKTSIELAKEIADFLEENGFKAGVREFDKKINIEYRKEGIVVIFREERGIGGFPYGFEGKGLLLFSGGFDSSLSLVLSAKQGIKVSALLFTPSDDITEMVKDVFEEIKKMYYIRANLIVERIPTKIFLIEEKLRQFGFKRFIYKRANEIAKKIDAEAIITGEVIGQTHTQRLSNLKLLERGIDYPVLRPLAFKSKNEIVDEIRKTGLFDKVSKIPEFCALAKKVKVYISKKDVEYIDKEIEGWYGGENSS